MDVFEKKIVDTITKIRKASKRPDVNAIYKYIQSHNATNITKPDVENTV